MAEAAAAARAMAAPWSLPARLGAGARARLTSWSIAATLAALGAATRLPLGGRYLFDWDSLQFALGMRRFDLAAHRPHPPGYVGYVAAGKVLAGLLGGDANRGLVWLSGVAEAATIAGIFLVAERLWGRFAGLAAAALMLSSPLFWMYGETALTYGLEPGLALLGFWLVWRAVGAGGRGLAVAALVIGLVGAIRPSTEFFLLPLLALGVWLAGHDQASPPWPGRPAARLLSVVGGLAAGTLVWLVPLLALSGGPVAYLAASAALAHRVSGGSAIWRAGSGGLLLDARAVFDGLAYSLGLYLPLAAGALVAARLAPARWPAPGGGGRRFGRPGTARTRRPVPLGTAETRRPVPLGTAGTRRLVLLGTAWALPALL
ncbi:MAG TPA: hypothetical protein VG245_07570, partial [Candidatus Dormibacteraeota bacterium]|nr:hypothetical protein [Candidatus Dormibacteraeota bacterium]